MAEKKIPGVGWTLQPGAKTWRGGLIRTAQHPTGELTYQETLGRVTIAQLERRWPEYSKGYDHTPSEQLQILSTVARAGRIPRMGDPSLYTLVPTAEQVIDFAALDRRHPDRVAIWNAWLELSASPADPKPDPKPDPGPVTTPVVPPAPAGGLRPLSPAAVRVEEVVEMLKDKKGAAHVWLPEAILEVVWRWEVVKPFAVEALRFYRLLRRHLGDSRPIPQEDRP